MLILTRIVAVLSLCIASVCLYAAPLAKITGHVTDPKVTPILFPFSKYLLAPLHPIRSLEWLFSSPETTSDPK